MFLAILTLITALAISAVAIYYSVAGLVAIFAAAAVPIMIMGGVLEIGKLVTAVWLHKYWKQAAWWLRTYLSVAVFVLMLITSMGIFGFLSKAHIEQTSAGEESIARVETIQNEIDRQLGIVGRAENRVRQLESSETGADENVQSQIDKEQERIDTAYERIKPAIAEQNEIIAGVTQLFQNELDKIDTDLTTLQGYVDNGEIKKAQQMIGASADGIFGKKTAEKIGDWKEAKQAERAEWLTKIQDAANSPTVQAARKEIARLRDNADRQIEQSNLLINRLRDQLGDTSNQEEIQKNIDEQLERVRTASSEIETLTEEKIGLESEYRKLEAEVGPIKYIAEFIYGEEADKNLLEEAVRWVIITIIFVFDPLAVLLLIASQYHFQWRHEEKYGKLPPKNNPPSQPQHTPPQDSSEPEDDDEWFDVRQLDPKPLSAAKIKEFQERERKESQMLEDIARREREKDEPKKTQKLSDIKKQMDENKASMQSQLAKRKMEDFDEAEVKYDLETTVEKKKIEIDTSVPPADEVIDELIKDAEQNQPEPIDVPLDDNARERLRIYEEKDKKLFDQKKHWKNDHPGDTIKKHKEYFVKGIIDRLPWEDYVPKQEEPPMPLDQWNQMIAEAEKEVSKEAVKKKISEEKDIHNERSGESNQNKVQKQRIKPDLTTVLPPNFEMDVQNYVQNEEQNNNSVWKKIKK